MVERCLAGLGVWLFLATLMVGREVSREPPEVFAQRLAPLLTPIEDVLPGREAFPDNREGGIALLREEVAWADVDGTLYWVERRVFHATDTAGSKELATLTFLFDADRERIALVEAYTRQSDGTILPVSDNAAFIQTPQHEAANSLYTSQAELSLLFRDVRVGSTVVATVIREEFVPVIPGEFVHTAVFGGGWPSYRIRSVVDLPAEWASRTREFRSSPLVPVPVREELPDGRVRQTWELEHVPGLRWEPAAPDIVFLAPTVRLSSLEDWQAIGQWYHGLLEPRGTLSTELLDRLAEWTDALEDERDIIHAVHRRIAQDVRYTGLEFGLAGYQPYSCSDVWENKYGDCKDKANLLVALLRRKGIDAHVALLTTSGHGDIEKRSPSWTQFNHAIAAIRLADGSDFFCDPTVRYLEAGDLPFGDRARDVLVIRPDRAEWVRTPDGRAGGITVDFDLALDASGEIGGWVELIAEKADAAWYLETFRSLDAIDRQRVAHNILSDFIPGLRIIDVAFDPDALAPGEFRLRAYLLRSPVSGAVDSIGFPYPSSWLPPLRDERPRRTPFRTLRRFERMTARFELPFGYFVSSVPEPFSAAFEGASFSARWEVEEDGVLSARLEWEPHATVMPPESFERFRRGIFAMDSWLDRRAMIVQAGPSVARAERPVVERPLEATFPLLSSGNAQMELLRERFSEQQDPELYRLALEKVLQWFPDDPNTVFQARLYRAMIGWTDDTDSHVIEVATDLLEHLGNRVTLENRAWAEFILARATYDNRRDPRAVESLRSLTENHQLSLYRRTWAAFFLARYLADTKPAEALAVLEQFERYDEGAQIAMLELHLSLLQDHGSGADVVDFLQRVTSLFLGEADAAVRSRLQQLAVGWSELSGNRQREIFTAVTEWLREHPELEVSSAAWRAAGLDPVLRHRRNQLALRVRAHVQRLSWLDPGEAGSWTAEQQHAAMKSADAEGDAVKVVRYAAAVIVNAGATYAQFTDACHSALWRLRDQRLSPELFATLAIDVRRLPPDAGGNVFLAVIAAGRGFAQTRNEEQARACFEWIITHPDAADYLKVTASGRLGMAAIGWGDLEAAEAAFSRYDGIILTNTKATDYLLFDYFVALENGNRERARRCIELMRSQEDRWIDSAHLGSLTRLLLDAATDVDALEAYWDFGVAWWPQWEAFAVKAGVAPLDPADYLTLDSLKQWKADLDSARQGGSLPDYVRHIRFAAMCARWFPGFSGDLAGALTLKGEVLDGEAERDALELFVAFATGAPSVTEGTDLDLLGVRGESLLRLRRFDEAVVVIEDLIRRGNWELPLVRIVVLGWLRSALEEGKGHELPIHHLSTALRQNEWRTAREEAAEPLGRALAQTRQWDRLEDLVLLERRQYEGGEEPPYVSALARMLAVHNDEVARAYALTARIDEWLAQWELDWLTMVPPFDLEDPRHHHQPAPFESEDGWEGYNLKANLLAAQDVDRPYEEREAAFFDFVPRLMFAVPADFPLVEAFESALLVFPEGAGQVQGSALAFCVIGSLFMERADQALALLELPQVAELRPDAVALHRVRAETLRHLLEMESDPAHLLSAVERLLALPANWTTGDDIERILRRLVYRGFDDEADALYAQTAELTVAPDEARSLGSFRAQWRRALGHARAVRPLFHRVTEVILSTDPRYDRELGREVRLRSEGIGSRFELNMAEGRAFALYAAEAGEWDKQTFNWYLRAALEPLLAADQYEQPSRQLLDALLDSGMEDEETAELLNAVLVMFDIDRAGDRAFLEERVHRYFMRNPDSAAFRRIWARHQVRSANRLAPSEDARPHALYGKMAELVDETVLAEARVLYHYVRGQRDALLGSEDAWPWSAVRGLLPLSLLYQTFHDAGRSEEAEWLEAGLNRIQQRYLANALIDVDFALTRELAWASIATGRSEWVPDGLWKHLERRSRNELQLHSVGAVVAYAQQRWNAVVSHADSGLAIAPEHYDLNGMRAMARIRAGADPLSVIDDLNAFLDHSRDHMLHLEARELRDSISRPTTAQR